MGLASVLLVDDVPATLAFNSAILGTAGYAVDEATSGRRALARVQTDPPDIVITKILMADGDGIELIAALKRSHRNIHIVAISERRFLAELDLFELARKLGADDVLEGPIRPLRLLAVVAQLAAADFRRPG